MHIDITPIFTKRLPASEEAPAFDSLLLIPQEFLPGDLEMVVLENRRDLGALHFKSLQKGEALELLRASAPLAVEIYVVYGDFSSSTYRWALRKRFDLIESIELCLTAVVGDLDESRAKHYEGIMRSCYSRGLCDEAYIDYSMWGVKRESLQVGV